MDVIINGMSFDEVTVKSQKANDSIDMLLSSPKFLYTPGGTYWNDDPFAVTDALSNLENLSML